MTYTKKFHPCCILQGFPDPINNSAKDLFSSKVNLMIKSNSFNAYLVNIVEQLENAEYFVQIL